MQIRQLKRTLNTFGLVLHAVDGNFADATNIRLKAPDGTVGRFTISRIDDPHSDRLNIGQFRRFARDHSHSKDLPGMVELDVINVTPKDFTPVEFATKALVHAKDPDAKEFFKERMENGAPVSGDTALMVAATSPPPPPPAPKPQPPVTFKGIAEALVKAEKKLAMTKPTLTIAKPTMTEDTKRKPARKQVLRIGQVEFFKLCNILNDLDMVGITSYPKLADKLSIAYGKRVAVTTAEDAVKATGKRLDKPVEVTDAQTVIARALVTIMTKLGEPVPDELRSIVGDAQ